MVESGFLRAPHVRRTWSPRGQTPVLVQRTRAYQKVSVIGALCVPPQRDRVHLYFRLHPDTNLTGPLVIAFLRQLARQLDAPFVLLWDRLRAHRAAVVHTVLQQTPQIHRVFFPPYAPELNPIELAWGYLKGNPFANWPLTELDTLTAVTHHQHRHLQRDQDLLRSFIKHSPLSLRLK